MSRELEHACSHDGRGLPGCPVCDPDVDELERRANDKYTCDGFRRRDVQKLCVRVRELEQELEAVLRFLAQSKSGNVARALYLIRLGDHRAQPPGEPTARDCGVSD